jgi:hypothetical protein
MGEGLLILAALAIGTVAAFLAGRLPMSSWAALVLVFVPFGGVALAQAFC